MGILGAWFQGDDVKALETKKEKLLEEIKEKQELVKAIDEKIAERKKEQAKG